MNRALILAFTIASIAGCGGTNSSSLGTPGLYSESARNSREREEMVSNATRNLGKGESAKVVPAINAFGQKLAAELNLEQSYAISPAAMTTNLSLLLSASVGKTREEIQKAMGWEKLTPASTDAALQALRTLISDETNAFQIANALWVPSDQPLQETFLRDAQTFFNAKVGTDDLTTENGISELNVWVKTATAGRVPALFDKPLAAAGLVAINLATFETALPGFSPIEAAFDNGDGKPIIMPFAVTTASLEFGRTKEGTQWARIPLGSNRELVLQMRPAKAPLADPNNLHSKAQSVTVQLPLVSIDTSTSAKDALAKLGISQLFADSAELPKMRAEKDVRLSQLHQRTHIRLTATGEPSKSKPAKETITFSRPFSFAIVETRSKQTLFIGEFFGSARA